MILRDDIVGLAALDIVELVHRREVTPSEVLRAHFQQIAALDARVGAFQLVCAERAIADAACLEGRNDLADLPLAGVPVAIKDNLEVAGDPMRHGSLATSAAASPADHEIVRRLREAGAIVVGKTRVPELCAWGWTDSAFGVTRSPWDLARIAGGSSGGSAAAVAAAMVPISSGSDGGGSIRIPSAACGLFGIKPGIGLTPGTPGHSGWFGLSANGPLATTVDDAAAMLAVMAARPELAGAHLPDQPLRVALSLLPSGLGTSVDPEWAKAASDTARLLERAGHHVVEADPPYDRRLLMALGARGSAGIAEEAAGMCGHLLERRTRPIVLGGRAVKRLGLVRAADRDRWRAKLSDFFEDFDVLISPTLAGPTPFAEGWARRSFIGNIRATGFIGFTGAWNLAGYPAAAVPAGLDGHGLPLSVQVIAPEGADALVLAVAKQLEQMRPWPRHAPTGR